ncbi:cytoskeleton-associated protein 4, partial [Rhinatrema bivittatum]|uniref:cytoskeleton-associated protein 4 n=1 Tax=Rhinatrema bivittatum TaxID=194408 RepID=UPI001128D9CF
VQSLEVRFVSFQSVLKEVEQKQEGSEEALRESESEVRKVRDVLKSLQDEILTDLSRGIQDVKDARERDFPFFEKSIEEKLTELTTSINDNISLFTAVQKRSEEELSSLKAKVASFEVTDLLKSELKVLEDKSSTLQAALELLRSRVASAEAAASTNTEELNQLREAHERLEGTVEAQRAALKAVTDGGESMVQLSSELGSLREEVSHTQSRLREQEQRCSESMERSSKSLESRLGRAEESLNALTISAEEASDTTNTFLSKYEDLHGQFAATRETVDAMKSLITVSDSNSQTLRDDVWSLRQTQESLSSKLQELQTRMEGLPNTTAELHKLEGEVKTQALPDKVATLEGFVSQVHSDLGVLRTALDTLLAYSAKTESNEKRLEAMRGSLDELRYQHERMLEKIERVQEAV